MAVSSKIKIAGLFTSGNQVSGVPDGALSVADNVVMRSNGMLEPRRGMGAESVTFGSSTTPRALAFYGSGRLVQYSESGSEKLAYSTTAGGAWNAYSGTYSPVDTTLLRMKFVEAAQNLYFNTSVGLKVLTSLSGTPTVAGVPAPLDIGGFGFSGGAPGATGTWLLKDSSVAYRIVYGIRDSNNNLKLGQPSGRMVATNSADVTVASGSLVRSGNVVTATVTAHGFKFGQQITLTNPSGSFASAGPFTIASASATAFQYLETAANATSGTAYTFTSGTQSPTLAIYFIGSELTTSHFFRIYRSVASSSASADPGDELFQIYERRFTATELATLPALITFTDTTPESSLYSSPLYTNPKTGDGIASANAVAPISKDLALWQERLWYANTTDYHRYSLQMLGASAPEGVQDGDLLAIGGTIFYFLAAGGSASPNGLNISIEGSYTSLSKNTEITTQNLLYGLNYTAPYGLSEITTAKGFYTSGYSEAPGKMTLQGLTLGQSAFYMAASRPASWNPVPATLYAVTEASSSRTSSTNITVQTSSNHDFAIGDSVYLACYGTVDTHFPVGVKTVTAKTANTFSYTEAGSGTPTMSGTYYAYKATATSTNDAKPNGISYSKFQEHEATPTANYLTVGAKNKEIKRIIPLRDKLYVFKEDGIFLVSGQPPFLSVDCLDPTVKLIAPDSVVTLGNLIYALTNQGVVTVSDSGVSVLSYPIESDLLSAVANYASNQITFGVSYESDRLYILALPSAGGSSSVQYVYNYLTKSWTTWSVPLISAGGVDPASDDLTVINALTSKLSVERKASGVSSYYDATASRTSSAVNTTAQTISVTGTSMAIGTMLDAGNRVMIRSAGTTNVTYSYGTGGQPSNTSAISYAPFTCSVAFAPNSLGQPGLTKHYKEATLHFRSQHIFLLGTTFANEYTTATSTVAPYAEGVFDFVGNNTQRNVRVLIPTEIQRGTSLTLGFTVSQALAFWQLEGYSVDADFVSHRVNK